MSQPSSKSQKINRAKEMLNMLERVLHSLERISDALHYEDAKPVTYLDAREIEDIYYEAIANLAPIETLIRKVRDETPKGLMTG